MQLNCKEIKKWQAPISTSTPVSGLSSLSSKNFGNPHPPSDSVFGKSKPLVHPLMRGVRRGFQVHMVSLCSILVFKKPQFWAKTTDSDSLSYSPRK